MIARMLPPMPNRHTGESSRSIQLPTGSSRVASHVVLLLLPSDGAAAVTLTTTFQTDIFESERSSRHTRGKSSTFGSLQFGFEFSQILVCVQKDLKF